jgi:hypothetical protein
MLRDIKGRGVLSHSVLPKVRVARKGNTDMEKIKPDKAVDQAKTPTNSSAVRAVISWLIKTDREYRVAQSMVNETHDKL